VIKKCFDGRAFTAGPNFGVKAACTCCLSLDRSQRMRSGFLINASRLECLGCLLVCPLCPLAETSKKVDGCLKFSLDREVTFLHLAYTIYVTKLIIIIIIIIIIELANEICAMWKQNAVQVIPIAISSTGVIPKSLSQSLKR
jgi:hypothetical protein